MGDSLSASTVMIGGHGGDEIEAYLARPDENGQRGGVVVIHHLPGYDRATKEITRRFAELGYDAICPNLHWREAPGAAPDDASAAVRARGGVSDERLVGDVGGAVAYLRTLASSNGKVGVIGYCSGGRQSVLVACSVDVDAAVDCYGAFVTGTPPANYLLQVTNLVDVLPDLRCPLLGLFGNEDVRPSPGARRRARAHPHRARQDLRVPSLRRRRPRVLRHRPTVVPRRRGQRRLGTHRRLLRRPPVLSRGAPMCSYATVTTAVDGSAKGPNGRWFHVTDATVYFDHPVHALAEHTLNIDVAAPARGPEARVALELTETAARDLVIAIQQALASAPA